MDSNIWQNIEVGCDSIELAELDRVKRETSALAGGLGEAVQLAVARVAAIACIVLSMPILCVLALVVKLESHGPALYRQTRVGINRRSGAGSSPTGVERRRRDIGGKPFSFYKFRTMYCDARKRFPELYRYEYTDAQIESLYFKMADDPRLTPVGRWLRSTTLDELPNFINVVKGDMSWVGPRPEIPEMVQYYSRSQRVKFSVKPGVTGLAQVSGRGLLSFEDTVSRDIEYVQTRSLSTNLWILVQTLKVTLLRVGAF